MKQLKWANAEEDKMIKQLEKRLKLNKRKSKFVPKSFVEDGLDCILYNFVIFKIQNIFTYNTHIHVLSILFDLSFIDYT